MTDNITVGTGATEFSYPNNRTPYTIIDVQTGFITVQEDVCIGYCPVVRYRSMF